MVSNTMRADARQDASLVERGVFALRRSFFLSLTVFGVLVTAIGYTFEVLWMLGHPVEDGVLAGMFGIWGLTAFTLGLVGYGTLRYLRNY
ncbi:hypothetical protein [Haloarchaeobius sp. DFWS5]|uniref:hypothetical protein n=1 Tax=Haloarchaeobius sp. DFWS5 TaxID=3446114 RepID=UPI003EBB874F